MKSKANKSLMQAALALIATQAVAYVFRAVRHRRQQAALTRTRAGASDPDRLDRVHEASLESFPASDSPSFSPGRA